MIKKSTKNAYVYSAYDLKGNLICEGTARFVASMLGTDPNNVCMNSISGCVLFGEFRIERKLSPLSGNSYMTMLTDIKVNGSDSIIDKSIEYLSNLINHLKEYRELYKNPYVVMDDIVASGVSLDELRIMLNLNHGMSMKNREFEESKREFLKETAKKLDEELGN